MNKKLLIFILIIVMAIVLSITIYLINVSLSGFREISDCQSFDCDVLNAKEVVASTKRNVLFISSYSPTFETFSDQIDGVKSVLDKGSINLDFEFMDSKRLYEEDSINNFYEYIKHKLSKLEDYDAIIVGDNNALDFAIDHQEELFNSMPIVFLGINNVDIALEAAENPYITGVVENASIMETIEIAKSINPNAERVVALVDSTASGQADLEVFFDEYNRVNDLLYDVIDLSNISFDQFTVELNKISKNDIVLLLSVYRDANNTKVGFEEGLKIVIDNCSQPIYHPYFHGLGSGVIGGKVISHYDQGKSAAEIVIRVLNGEEIHNIECITDSPNQVIFDYKMLEQYNIHEKQLPEDAVIVNSNEKVKRYFYQLAFGLILILVQLLIIIILFINIRRRYKVESEYKKFKLITDKALNGHLITDMNDIVYYCNNYYANSHGRNAEDVLGKKSSIFHTEEQWKNGQKYKEELLENKYLEPIEIGHLKSDGTEYPMLVSGIVYKDDDGKVQYIVYNAIDISNVKTLEQKSIALEAALTEQQRIKAIGTLASGIAHEINNPINGIMNYAQVIIDLYDDSTDANKYSLEIQHEADRISNIVRKLLNYARHDMTGLAYVKISDVINDTISLINTIIKNDYITLNIEVDPELPEVYCKSQEIQQIIMNLVTNSKDSLNKRYGLKNDNKIINIICKKHFIDNKEYIRTVVEDFGLGIEEKIAARIFEPFFTTKGRNEGTGLGLSISYRIAYEHGGNLSVDTKMNEYTKFYLDLPVNSCK